MFQCGRKILRSGLCFHTDESTRECELRFLRAVKDYYPKLILSMDTVPFTDFDGTQQRYIPDFLLASLAGYHRCRISTFRAPEPDLRTMQYIRQSIRAKTGRTKTLILP